MFCQYRKKKPLITLEAITGNEKDNYFLESPARSVGDPTFQDRVEDLVTKVLRSFCGLQ